MNGLTHIDFLFFQVLGTFGAYAWYSGVYKYQIDQIAAYKVR